LGRLGCIFHFDEHLYNTAVICLYRFVPTCAVVENVTWFNRNSIKKLLKIKVVYGPADMNNEQMYFLSTKMNKSCNKCIAHCIE